MPKQKSARRYMVTVWPGAEAYPELGDPADYDAAWERFLHAVLERARGSGRNGIGIRYLGGQFELGRKPGDPDGPPVKHIQAYMHLERAAKWPQARGLVPGAHLDICEGTPNQCIAYCSKADTRVSGPYAHGEPGDLGQGSRTDVSHAVKAVAEGADVAAYIIENPSALRHWRGLQFIQNSTFRPRDANKPPRVVWCWGPTGTGKTRWAWEQEGPEGTYSKPATTKWWPGYTQQACILIDDYRPGGPLSYQYLLKLFDRYPMQVEPKNGYVHINSPLIIITSPCNIRDTFCGHVLEDIEQIARRINEEKEFA